ncbi:MAG: 16S rRNA (guanine(966)-N(2))-methyltransferase RsmD [Cardiobacteriaceae bacterium]|nr:16S rRNA (guanine(966)-N(2))-methyltransferase RsmD [Cardiobacteriaceae bacterium]
MSHIRIISGLYKNRRIAVLNREGLRPSPERIRETLYNWLQFEMAGARVFDAFAGSGAMGLEALSRGAAWVDFCDTDRSATQAIQALLKTWKAENARVFAQSALHFKPSTPYDLILLDPPFSANLYDTLLSQMPQYLKPHGYLYLEYPRQQKLQLPPFLMWHKHAHAGNSAYGLLRLVPQSALEPQLSEMSS